jgi:hypothetical protein
MKLISLKAAGFRGFNDELHVDLDGTLIIYYGPNGSGKTSIGEAIEWLFYGKTIKRVKGDEISKREYEGSYRNAHYNRAANPFAEAHIRDGTGNPHVIRRELRPDETSTLLVDGKSANDLKQFGFGNLYDRPLILQHTLQDFVFMRPKTRYEILSAMLGLEPLIDLRSAVETAKTDFAKGLPSVATSAQNRAALLLNSYNTSALLQPVASAIGQLKVEDARRHLVQVAMGRVPAGTAEQDLLPALNRAKTTKERARLDWGHFSLSPVATPDLHPAISRLPLLRKHVEEIESHLAEAERKMDQPPPDGVSSELRQFYELGLRHRNKANDSECPFCLAETLTPERITVIHKAVELVPEAKPPLASTQLSLNSLQTTLHTQWLEARKMMPVVPNENEKETLEKLVPGGTGHYFSSCEVIKDLAPRIEEKKNILDISIARIREAFIDVKVPREVAPGLKGALESYIEEMRKLPGVANGYAANYSAMDPLVKSQLASGLDVRFLSLLIRSLEDWRDFEISQKIYEIQEDPQDVIRQTRTFIEGRQKEILGQRDAEIRAWYQLLSGGAVVGYGGMNPGTDNLELRARTFTKGMMAAPNLSASQLNCIGLAVYLATCTRKGSPFAFVLFDDPIQSMDDEHTEAFKKEVISKLIADGFQVILLTHMDQFANRVETLYRSRSPAIYRMDQYSQAGPIIEWKGPEVQKLLNDVKKNKDAVTEGYRKQAVQALRQFVEEFVKDLFMRDTGNTISRQYENRSWGELRKLLRQCTSFDPNDEPALEDTHSWTSPFLHTDETLAHMVPPSGHINPHYEAMKALLEKYKPILGLR